MDFKSYRNSGELSDITVSVDGQEFNLHKFPLFVRSSYFKNLTAENLQSGVTRVKLDKFPGGSQTFAIIADYCYDKPINVDSDNIVSLILATEYLEMHGMNNTDRSRLSVEAEDKLIEMVHSIKCRKDLNMASKLLDQAADQPALSEKSKLNAKLIDLFVDCLASSSSSASLYCKKNSNKANLSNEQTNILNNLPLDWMNSLVKSAAKNCVPNTTISQIIRDYIDYNTNLNPNYLSSKDPKSKEKIEKPTNLISMAADILKVDQRLADISKKDSDADSKPSNLIGIMTDIVKKEADDVKKLDSSSDDDDSSASQAHKPMNLIGIMGDLLKKDANKDADDDADDRTAGRNLVNIAAEALESAGKKKLEKPRENATKEEKIKIISTLLNSLDDSRVEPDFPVGWLLNYSNALEKLDADQKVKDNLKKWSLNAVRNSDNLDDLDLIPPAEMIKLLEEIIAKEDGKTPNYDNAKITNLIERYMMDMAKKNKLDPENFIKLAKMIPNDKTNHDNLALVCSEILENNEGKINKDKKDEMIDLIDFTKLNEETLNTIKDNRSMPVEKINEAALALCARLRKELDNANMLLRSTRPAKSGLTNYDSSSFSNRYPYTSTSLAYNRPYTSSYNYSKYAKSSDSYSSPIRSSAATTASGRPIPIHIQKGNDRISNLSSNSHKAYHHHHHEVSFAEDNGINCATVIEVDLDDADNLPYDIKVEAHDCLDDSDIIDCYDSTYNSNYTSYIKMY